VKINDLIESSSSLQTEPIKLNDATNISAGVEANLEIDTDDDL
jgi:hypothetical protein